MGSFFFFFLSAAARFKASALQDLSVSLCFFCEYGKGWPQVNDDGSGYLPGTKGVKVGKRRVVNLQTSLGCP